MTFGLHTAEEEEEKESLAKKPRLETDDGKLQIEDRVPQEFVYCQDLLLASNRSAASSNQSPSLELPKTLIEGGKIRNDLAKLKKVLDGHGLRTSVVSSPRAALSVYTDSCILDENTRGDLAEGKAFLMVLFGLHPSQLKLERVYNTSIKNVFCLFLFCHRLRQIVKVALTNESVADLVAGCELQCHSLGKMRTDNYTPSQILKHAHTLSNSVPRLVATLIRRVVQAEPRNRVEQLQREYERIALWNSTLSNAAVTLFGNFHQCQIKDIFFKRSDQQPKYERFTIYLYDPELDLCKPPQFLFLPSLYTALQKGPQAISEEMTESFWYHLLRHGYYATSAMKQRLSVDLEEYFLSGLTKNISGPLQLNAHFNPSRPLSFYLHGKAGVGKSSFVRNFQPALEATVEEAADPEVLARFVKQNLNKRYGVLELELELRPNNNDLSVMSIIQGRRMTMSQSKPGLVVVDFEEMPANDPHANPNQLRVAQLISQRFSGRNGAFQDAEKPAPRNSGKRGIANDASLITVFTSNYQLDQPSLEALKRLKMFENLRTVEITPISGSERLKFAESYLGQCIKDHFAELNPSCIIRLDLPIGNGDTRPLVRSLRMIAFYICTMVSGSVKFGGTIQAQIEKGDDSQCTILAGGASMDLNLGILDNLVPVVPFIFDPRIKEAMKSMAESCVSPKTTDELSIILDFWLAKTLAPAVIVSRDKSKIRAVMQAISRMKDVHCIHNVLADSYKMMKSLYDANDTPNLRDDILKFGRGANVAIELECGSTDAQLCIREIIEDSPSMTAFSTAKSALHKEGLIFAVHVGDEITPEVKSRASIVI